METNIDVVQFATVVSSLTVTISKLSEDPMMNYPFKGIEKFSAVCISVNVSPAHHGTVLFIVSFVLIFVFLWTSFAFMMGMRGK